MADERVIPDVDALEREILRALPQSVDDPEWESPTAAKVRNLAATARRSYPESWNEEIRAVEADRDRLARRVAELEAALRWYGERRNYVPAAPPATPPPKHLMATDAWDGEGPGARARAALAGDGGGAKDAN